MRIKILILGLIFVFLIACEGTPENPYSPEPPIVITQVEFKIEMFTNVTDIMYYPPDGYWFIIAETYAENESIGEIKNPVVLSADHVITEFIPPDGFQVDKWYEIKFKFKDTDILPEWQESISFCFYANLRTADSNYKIEGGADWYPGWKSFKTDWFSGWKIGEWKDIPTNQSSKFRVIRK